VLTILSAILCRCLNQISRRHISRLGVIMFSAQDINIRDLFDLIVSEVDDPHEKLSQLYLWKYDYAMSAAKATTAAGASFLVGLILAILEAKPHLGARDVIIGFVGSGLIIIVGIFQYMRLRSIYKQYVAAHYLLSEVARMRKFLQLYRSDSDR